MTGPHQHPLFAVESPVAKTRVDVSSTFLDNMKLPVHRWFRYSAGFSADWVKTVISSSASKARVLRVFDPFAGSATTLIAAESAGVESVGIDSHPFVARIAKAKLAWRTDPKAYLQRVEQIRRVAQEAKANLDIYPPLIRACYDDYSLAKLDLLRQSFELTRDETPSSELCWLTLIGILRKVSQVGTAPWQYVLPKKPTARRVDVTEAFEARVKMIYSDMNMGQKILGPRAKFFEKDARSFLDVPGFSANLVITSPPYPNNYDYADATRLEMTFMREITGWGELQERVRKHLVRSCSQHVTERSIQLEEILASPELEAIRPEISQVCEELAQIRLTKGGKKTYHLMIACYFRDLARVWQSLRRICDSPSRICFVVGDSAPYGVYVPTITWLERLALAAGFASAGFKKTRDRNVKWKNRKHRVPLQEGHLWIEG